ncbi:MAG: sigma-70 family RNA polymerase sigma factor [Desulfobacteraceae bacterium]|nr:sigma-70 family RNA polymerase sigma factor [Desulfobacteraceae bacterium]
MNTWFKLRVKGISRPLEKLWPGTRHGPGRWPGDSPETGTRLPLQGAAQRIMAQETAAMVRSALDALAPNQRMAIVLRYYENLHYREIAAALDISPKAVERLLARARERLRNTLGNRDVFFHF